VQGGAPAQGLCWLLQRGGERLGPAEGRRLAAALLADGRLARAWGLKEPLRPLYRLPRLEQAEAALGRWLQEAEASGLAPFQRTARTLERWQRELLNCWRYPIRGALVEGKHNRIKALKRRDYGCRNGGSFLLRILSQIHISEGKGRVKLLSGRHPFLWPLASAPSFASSSFSHLSVLPRGQYVSYARQAAQSQDHPHGEAMLAVAIACPLGAR
jgi:hypothetical protein